MTKDTSGRSLISQLFDTTVGQERMKSLSQGRQFLEEEEGSVLKLVKLGRQGLMDSLGLTSHEAQLVLDKAHSTLVHVARQFRTHRTIRHVPRNLLHYTGIDALLDAPNYEKLFDLDWAATTPVGSLDANDSPAAYFIELFKKALELEKRDETKAAEKIPLLKRRPDLATRVIDPQMAYRMTPTVVLVNEVLGSIIENHPETPLATSEVIDDRLLNTRYPMTSLPFEWYQEQWDYVLQQNEFSLGDIVRIADPASPYFKEEGAHGGRSAIAMRQASGLGPVMQALLLEDRYQMAAERSAEPTYQRVDARTGRIDPDPQTTDEDFFMDNFGASHADLLDAVKFCNQTSIDSDQLASLLSIERYAPAVSPNFIPKPESRDEPEPSKSGTPNPKTFGSVFINAEGPGEAIGITQPADGEPDRELLSACKRRFDLINRMLRLARKIKLPYDQCDRLLVAAIRAEARHSANEPASKARTLQAYKISSDTLRAIGVFQDFRRAYKCSAEDFAALIDEISVYTRGEQQSQFDRIFNRQSLFDTPLRLDGGSFAINPQDPNDQRTVDQICSGLAINLETWRYLSRVVAECYGLRSDLKRDVRIISSFYRLVRLASFCGITSIELAALLETMSPRGSDWLRELLGHPHIGSYRTIGRADVLDVLHAVQSCVRWCRENNLEVVWLVQHVSPVIVPVVASEAEVTLLQELRKRLEPTRLSEDVLLGAGVPPVKSELSTDWMTLLDQLVDANGLILPGLAQDDASYENWVREEIAGAVTQAKIDVVQVEAVKATIVAIMLQARAAQNAVVQESLSVYLGVAQDLALVVLRWVEQKGVYLLLDETLRVLGDQTRTEQTIRVDDAILKVLAHLVRRTAVVKKLALSSAMLATLTTQDQWRWFGLRQVEELTLDTFYLLTIFGRAVVHTEEPAEKLLAYLKTVNDLPAELTGEDIRLIRDGAASLLAQAVKWGIKEVLECATYLTPDLPLVREMSQIDFVIRARGLAATSGLDAKAILTLGMLSPESDVVSCRQAAEHALQCLSESAIQSKALEFGEVGQSVTGTTMVSTNRLIANAPNEFARVEIMLRDFQNEPLSNITVTWECERSGLQELTSVTDHEGRASVRFKAGAWMGLAKVVARYGLGQRVYAEPILIDCDEDSIDFMTDAITKTPDAPVLAGNLEFVELQIRLKDSFGNLAIDRPVKWGCSAGNLDPVVSFTDKDGFASTRLRSHDAAENVSATAQYAEMDLLNIGGISFVDRARISLWEAVSPAVVGVPLELRCLVLGLDGRPFAGAEVTFEMDVLEQGKGTSDERGEATFSVIPDAAGTITLKASVEGGSKTLEIVVVATAVIHGESADYLLPVAGSERASELWIEVRESAQNNAPPIARYPIVWTVYLKDKVISKDGEEPELPPTARIATDIDGRSTFPFFANEPGSYAVTAAMAGMAAEKRVFNLQVVKPLEWTITLIDRTDPTSPIEETILSLTHLDLQRGHTYELNLTPHTDHDLKGARAALGWSAPFSAKAMGMTFAPLTGAYTEITGPTMSWHIDCGNLRDGEFELTWLCNRIDQTLVLTGKLSVGAPVVQHPLPASRVEQRMVVGGTGVPGRTIEVFTDKNSAYDAQATVNGQGLWSVQLPQPQAVGDCTLSVRQLSASGEAFWATDITVTVENAFQRPHMLSPVHQAQVSANPRFVGFGRPGAVITVLKAGVVETIYAKGTVPEGGRWSIPSSNMRAPMIYGLDARLTDGALSSPWLTGSYKVEVINPSESRHDMADPDIDVEPVGFQ